MKIGEVCERTGLTKRAVRFYIECGLVDPEIVERNFKEYREYSAEDERRLKVIAVLRQSQFTIEQIKQMLQKPMNIPTVLQEYQTALSNQTKVLTDLKAGADVLMSQSEPLQSAEHVAEALREFQTHSDPDMTPHFRRYDDESMDEQIEPRHTKLNNILIILLLLLSLTVGAVIGVLRWNDWVAQCVIGTERAQLVDHTENPEETSIYYLPSGSLMTVRLVEKRSDSFEAAGVGNTTALVKEGYSSTAYSTYEIEIISKHTEESVRYRYDGRNASEAWVVGNHDVEGFGLYATITKEQNGNTEENMLKDPQNLTTTEKLVTDAITALRNYTPLWKMLLVPMAASMLAVVILWFLLKKLFKL